MNKPLRKLLVCGASLLMMASLGTGINNVSARRTNHHARTHRVVMSSHALYKQGEKDQNNYLDVYNGEVTPKVRKVENKIINHMITFHFNKSYMKGFHPHYITGMSTFEDYENLQTVINNAKKVERQRNRKPAKRHAKRRVIKSHKNTKRVRKSVKRNKRTRKVAKHNYKRANHKHNKRLLVNVLPKAYRTTWVKLIPGNDNYCNIRGINLKSANPSFDVAHKGRMPITNIKKANTSAGKFYVFDTSRKNASYEQQQNFNDPYVAYGSMTNKPYIPELDIQNNNDDNPGVGYVPKSKATQARRIYKSWGN